MMLRFGVLVEILKFFPRCEGITYRVVEKPISGRPPSMCPNGILARGATGLCPGICGGEGQVENMRVSSSRDLSDWRSPAMCERSCRDEDIKTVIRGKSRPNIHKERHYARRVGLNDKRVALEKWAVHLSQVIEGGGETIVPFEGRVSSQF